MTTTLAETPWRSPWSATAPISIDYAFVGVDDTWTPDVRPGFLYRDLGLAQASGGFLHACHWRRAAEAPIAPAERSSQRCDFRFFYVVRGWITVETASGDRATLGVGGVGRHGPDGSFAEVAMSDDFEAIEISAPADGAAGIGAAGIGAEAPRPTTRDALARVTHPFFLPETAESFVIGAGPRRYFAYRDLKVADITDRRIFIHVVRALEPMPGGTGWHTHTMSQLFVVLDGWAEIAVEGQVKRRMTAGDAMCLRAGMRHDVPDFSADYKVLEMCVPADYETTAVAAPAA